MLVTRELTPAGKALEAALRILKDKQAKVGWFEGSKYEDGTPVAGVAAQNEFGNPAKRIPARPFMRPTITEKETAWGAIAERGVRAVLASQATTQDVMELLAKTAVFDIQKTIAALQTPELSPVTIKHRLERKSDKKTVGALTKPLIDTNHMFSTINHEIEDV